MTEARIESSEWLERWSLKGWKSYVLAGFLAVASMGLRVVLTPQLGEAAPYPMMVPALVLVAFISGFKQALFLGLIALSIGWMFLFPTSTVPEKLLSGGFSLVATIIAAGTVAWQRVLMERIAASRVEASRLLRVADQERARAEAERDRAALLSRELNHRVKNLFAVVSAIVSLSGRSEPQSRETINKIRDRIGALASAHTVGLGEDRRNTTTLEQIVETMLSPYQLDGNKITIEGPEALLPFEAVTPLAMILHELSTNAIKYGALSVTGGEVHVLWSKSDTNLLRFSWEELGGPAISDAPDKSGFGSTMLTQAERQLGATVTRDWLPTGLNLTLEFPLHRSPQRNLKAATDQ